MVNSNNQPLATRWILFSLVLFVAAEVVIGGLVGHVVIGRYVSHSLRWFLQGALHLAAFFVGGLIVGIVSPGVRITEPAVGAFLAVAITLLTGIFSPSIWLQFSLGKLLIGGLIAYVLALSGAKLGERITGNRV
jgi:hypothetical protein